MTGRPVLVLHDAAGPVPGWLGRLGAEHLVVDPGAPTSAIADAAAEAEAALVGAPGAAAVELARRIHGADPTLQVVLVADPSERPRTERTLLFTPGAGEVWIVTPTEVVSELLERAASVTRQRRSYRVIQSRIEHDLATLEPLPGRRAVISDAYLASLLAVLPDPILSVDIDGRVLSWNAAAGRVLGVPRSAAIGQLLHDVLRPEDRLGLERILANAQTVPLRGELQFRRADGELGIAEVAIVPVDAGGHRVRAVVVHDVTDERRLQEALEAQAAELEVQAVELESSQLDLQAANADLQRINVELATRTREAEHARAEADAANRAKGDFLATVSHEIRTPINAIIGYSELLELGLAGDLTEAQASHLGRIRSSSSHLLALIEDILDMAKMEAGRIEFVQAAAPIVPTIAAALSLVAPQAAEKEIRIIDRCSNLAGLEFVGDERRVQQILINLLSNAVKFTGRGGEVLVSCGTDADAAEDFVDPEPHTSPRRRSWISISDTGIGIVPDALERVFRPFEQVESGHTRLHGGTGLGLSISRRFARLMGGDITVESTPGAGSTFTLWLPAEVDEPPRIEDEVIAEARSGLPAGLVDVGTSLIVNVEAIVRHFRERVSRDPGIAMAAGVTVPDIEDHIRTLLTDIGQNLTAMGRSEDVPEDLIHDGGDIQRVIARLHGAQRARLGWSEGALRRELSILREEAARAVRDALPDDPPSDEALSLLDRFLDRAEEVSAEALRRAEIEREK